MCSLHQWTNGESGTNYKMIISEMYWNNAVFPNASAETRNGKTGSKPLLSPGSFFFCVVLALAPLYPSLPRSSPHPLLAVDWSSFFCWSATESVRNITKLDVMKEFEYFKKIISLVEPPEIDRKRLESCYKGVQGREVMSPNNPEKKMWSRLCPREEREKLLKEAAWEFAAKHTGSPCICTGCMMKEVLTSH